MITITEKKNCTGCYACSNICPQHCITMESDSEGFCYPKVNMESCVNCGLCEKVCPVLHKTEQSHTPTAYATYNKEETVRMQSSSGGIFTLIADYVLDNNGIVYGVAFDGQFDVVHVAVDNKEDLSRLRGSKYVQSKIGDTYKQAKDFLREERQVLFTGTPCQIAGLKSYLGRGYNNLICQDIICHGVPSPAVWRQYLELRIQKSGASPEKITFRQKDKSWKRYDVQIDFAKGIIYNRPAKNEPYMRAFLSNVCLRPSCYDCQYKTLSRVSDVTLADYWDIESQHPEMDDDKGTSLVMIHSTKGAEVFDKLKDKICYKEVDAVQAVTGNASAVKSSAWNPKREKFFTELGNIEFDALIKKYCKDQISILIKRKVKLVVRAILVRLNLLKYVKRFL